ncbi:cystathionine gamma-lyase-like isoform X2 [Zootermopsis nevadensis]|uniref:cystathionine gamma-lyase n=1 Tax=Zootermopsis nevadensis TaxID=136037 RepID=A0A067QZT5_ZOONE|nr:cystathionine gamma-lyase-like isoform X1 [Zootermopsis nevadensis]XP_021933777.1 cystathionine gamma-lyase-like isoform X2 [Zootermopsis nevadensis]KDR11923.1 Cystathionine gamma-lyase [Zootermopsis nevadensis]
MSEESRHLGFDTKAVRLGYKPDVSNNYSLMPPIGLSSTFQQDDPSTHRGFLYVRQNNPSRQILEKGFALLEDAKYSLCFSSGTSAISAVVQLLNTGDHIVSSEVIFGGTYRYFDEITGRVGITTTYVDARDPENVENALQANTKLVFLETPSNPLLSLCDIARIAEIVHRAPGILFAVDNTFLTSYYQRPLDMGADISVYSATKYLNGHTDVCMGAMCFNDDNLLPRLRYLQNNAGIGPSPFDCYLVYRSLKTLPVRLRHHMKNGLKVAQFLESHPLVTKVLCPWLPSHPQHELAKRQASGYTSMISFYVNGDLQQTSALLKKFRLINMAGSLGGVESLAEIPSVLSHASFPVGDRARLGITDNLVRLSVGLEDVDDIIADLDQALRSTLL